MHFSAAQLREEECEIRLVAQPSNVHMQNTRGCKHSLVQPFKRSDAPPIAMMMQLNWRAEGATEKIFTPDPFLAYASGTW